MWRIAALVLLVAACGDDTTSPDGGTHPPPGACIPMAGVCPQGCQSVTGALVDANANCVHADVSVVLGCAPFGTGAPRIVWCYQSGDRTVTVRTDYQYEIGVQNDWKDCSNDLRNQVSAFPFCQ